MIFGGIGGWGWGWRWGCDMWHSCKIWKLLQNEESRSEKVLSWLDIWQVPMILHCSPANLINVLSLASRASTTWHILHLKSPYPRLELSKWNNLVPVFMEWGWTKKAQLSKSSIQTYLTLNSSWALDLATACYFLMILASALCQHVP